MTTALKTLITEARYPKQDVQKSIELSRRELASALGGLHYRIRGQGSKRGEGGRNDATMAFTPDEEKQLKKAEDMIKKAQELLADAYEAVLPIDLGFSDRFDPALPNYD